MMVDIVTIHPRQTWSKPNGEWGIDGVDLAALPPRVYGALLRLKEIEDAIEPLRAAPRRGGQA